MRSKQLYDENLLDLMTRMYRSEIHFGICAQWDSGIRAWIGWDEREADWRRTFSVGSGPNDYPNWQALWRGMTMWFAEQIVGDHENLEDKAPSDAGCLECTAGTTPNHLNTGWCAYHFAKHKILPTHGLVEEIDDWVWDDIISDAVARDYIGELRTLNGAYDIVKAGEDEARQHRSNLVALLRRLAYRHSKGLPLDEALAGAMDYLTRENLHPSILRDDGTTPAPSKDG